MLRNMLLSVIAFIYILFVFSIFIYSNDNKYYVTNVKEFIYNNLKLTEEDYKFINVKSNNVGELIYVYMLYKARGTLVTYVNLATNSMGYRILPEVKVPNTVAFNNKKEILINTLAMGNKFYYISPNVSIYSFDSPSYNLSEPLPSSSYFYWLGYKYNKEKKTDKKLKIFRYRYKNIEEFNISGIVSDFKKKGMKIVDLKPFDDYIIFNTRKQSGSEFIIFSYNLINEKIDQIYKGKGIMIDRSINKDLYFVEHSGSSLDFYRYGFSDNKTNKLFSLSTTNNHIYSFYCIESSISKLIFAFSLVEKNSKIYENMIIRDNKLTFDEKFSAPINVYFDRSKSKAGIFYLYDDSVLELEN